MTGSGAGSASSKGPRAERPVLVERAVEGDLDRHRRRALALFTDPRTQSAFDVEQADPKTLERYGKNKFGLSLLMARRLVEAGVNLVQVNLGKNSSWDTHVGNFRNLKDHLLPPADRAVSALLDDLSESGRLDSTLVVMTGEFGRTPKINKDAGRDHWGPVMTVLLAGGGIRGGTVIGASDRIGGVSGRGPTDAREPRGHDVSCARHPQDGHLARSGRPAARDLPRRAHRGSHVAGKREPAERAGRMPPDFMPGGRGSCSACRCCRRTSPARCRVCGGC